jgi:hypothetical protein
MPQLVFSQQQVNQTGSESDSEDSDVQTAIVTGASAVAGAVAGGLFTYWAAMEIEKRKDKEEMRDFERYRKGLIQSISAELTDYEKFVKEYFYPNFMQGDNQPSSYFSIDSTNIDLIKAKLLERSEYHIMGNTPFEQLVKSIDAELLVMVLSAYKSYQQLMEMAKIDINKMESAMYDKGSIPRELIKDFTETVDDIANRISKLK